MQCLCHTPNYVESESESMEDNEINEINEHFDESFMTLGYFGRSAVTGCDKLQSAVAPGAPRLPPPFDGG